jgi:hypothetical protein
LRISPIGDPASSIAASRLSCPMAFSPSRREYGREPRPPRDATARPPPGRAAVSS